MEKLIMKIQNKKFNKGYTLIEFLIVVAVVGTFLILITGLFNAQSQAIQNEQIITKIYTNGNSTLNVITRDLEVATSILAAYDDKIQFDADVTEDGVLDCVHYELVDDIIKRGVIEFEDNGGCHFSAYVFPDDFKPEEIEKVTKNVEGIRFVYYDNTGTEIYYPNDNLDKIKLVEIAIVIKSDKKKFKSFKSDNPLTSWVESDGYLRRVFRTIVRPSMLNVRKVVIENEKISTGEVPARVEVE